MATHELDLVVFRDTFPAFAANPPFTDGRIQAQWNMATGFISPEDGVWLMGVPLQNALNLLTAHLLQVGVWIAAGQTTVGVVTGATVDKVQVQLAAPASMDGWEMWLMATPYGQQLLTLLAFQSAGGFVIGGNPERDAFRRVYGGFGGPGGPNVLGDYS